MAVVLRDIALAREQTLNTKEDKPPRYRAVIVEQHDSSGKDAVYVEGRIFPFYLWVRMWNSGGSVLPAFNADNVPAIAGMPVYVTRSRGSDQELEIVGIDKEALQAADLPVGFSNIGQHAWAHEMPDGAPGFDPVTVYPRSWSQLKAYSSDPLSLVVNVSPLRYRSLSGLVVFNGGTVDLTAAVGALAANQARLVLIYLDISTNTLGAINGAIGTIAAGWFLPEPVMAGAIYPSAVVRIYNGQTEIGESDIRDRRMFLNAVAGVGGWPFNTKVITVDTLDIDADVATIALAIAAAGAGDLILASPETHTCDNQSLPAGVNMAGLDRAATLLQTTAQVIALTLNGNYLFRLTVDNDQSNAAAITAILVDDDGELRDVIATADNDGAGDARAISMSASVKDARLEDCDAEAISGAGDGYALYVAATSGTTEVRGGKYDGDTADIFVGASAIVVLYGPTLVNNTIAGTGTIKGWYYDANGVLRGVSDLIQIAGNDIYPSGDEAGIHHREANCFNLWNEHFDVAALPAGWAWAGAPFVVPGTVSFAAVPSVLTVLGISNWVDSRSFLFRANANALTYAMIGMNVSQVNSGLGVRLDDGSDNNYVEFRIYYSAAGPPETWQFQLVWRIGGGGVNTANGATIYIPNPMYILLYCSGTLWGGPWTAAGYVKGLGFGGLSQLKQATQAAFTFTPTRRGLIYRNAGPNYDTYYCDAFTPN